MKRSALIALGLILSAPVHAAQAVVVYNRSGCGDRFVAENNAGYILLEWYGGHDPSEGEILYGELHSYGFKDIVNNRGARTRVWVDDFMESESDAREFLAKHCN